jgi:hypothetical protein
LNEKGAFVKTNILLFPILLLWAVTSALGADPWIGTWKLNVAKSTYSPDAPPKSSTVVVEPSGASGVKVHVETINAQGAKITIDYTANMDGKPYPFHQTGPGAMENQTVTFKRIDAQSVERNLFASGKPVSKEIWQISKDGKVRTVTQTGTTADGKPIHNVLLQERQ